MAKHGYWHAVDAYGIPAILAFSAGVTVAGFIFLSAGGFHYAMPITGTLVALATFALLSGRDERR